MILESEKKVKAHFLMNGINNPKNHINLLSTILNELRNKFEILFLNMFIKYIFNGKSG